MIQRMYVCSGLRQDISTVYRKCEQMIQKNAIKSDGVFTVKIDVNKTRIFKYIEKSVRLFSVHGEIRTLLYRQ